MFCLWNFPMSRKMEFSWPSEMSIPNGNFFGELTNFGNITISTSHFNQPFLVWIFGDYLNHTFSSLLFFQQAGSMPGGATWAGSQWNHVWVSSQLLKNSFTTKSSAGFEPTPFDFWLPTPQFWLVLAAGVKHRCFDFCEPHLYLILCNV
jgi:hypothetical protein